MQILRRLEGSFRKLDGKVQSTASRPSDRLCIVTKTTVNQKWRSEVRSTRAIFCVLADVQNRPRLWSAN